MVNDEPSLVEANHLDQSKGPFENTESLLVNDDDTFGNIEETEHESEHIDGENNECELCKKSSQHPCRKCGQNLCVLFCSNTRPNI